MVCFFEVVFSLVEIIEGIIELFLIKPNDSKIVVTKTNANNIVDLCRKIQRLEIPT